MCLLANQTGSLITVKMLTVGLGAAVCLLTLELTRRDLLRMAYALLWLLSGAVIILIGLFPPVLDLLQRVTGMNYQTAMLFCVFGFMVLLMMQFSILVSRLSHRNKNLAQDVAILREQVRELSEKVNARSAELPRADG